MFLLSDGKVDINDLNIFKGCYSQNVNSSWKTQLIEKLSGIFDVLNFGIMDKLTQIAISLQNIENKECKWERINQEVGEMGEPLPERIVLPRDIAYSTLRVINAAFYGGCSIRDLPYVGYCELSVNNQKCLQIHPPTTGYFNLDCLNLFKDGINIVTFTGNSSGNVEAAPRKLFIEMEVKPKDC